MYSLYYAPATCSLAIHVLLNELERPVKLINKSTTQNFADINPTEAVPVLKIENDLLSEGAAIALYLMEKYKSPMLPLEAKERITAIQWMMFANATMHPAYSKIFFIIKNIEKGAAQEQAIKAAVVSVEKLWAIVDSQLENKLFVNGENITMADIMLSVYANWNNFFPFDIKIGENVKRLLLNVSSRPSFKNAIESEKIKYVIK